MKIFAQLINLVFHPVVLVSPVVFLIVLGSTNQFSDALFWALVSLGFVILISSYILIGMRFGFFTNFDVSKRQQRIYLFPAVIIAGLLYLLSIIYLKGPRELIISIVYFLVSVFVLAVVTLKIKASVHVGAITAGIVSTIYFFGSSYNFLLFLIPLMAWARIKQKRHTLKETIVGFLLGLLLAILGIFSVQYLL